MERGHFEKTISLNFSAKELETVHLKLRHPTTEDMKILCSLWQDAKVRQFLGGILSDKDIEGKIISIQDHWNRHKFGQFAVYEKNTKRIIGICGLHYSENGIEISYMFFPVFWGKKFATEAALASLNYGFNFLKIDRVMAITQEANLASWRLLEKIGMHYVDNLWQFNAAQRMYELTQSEWFARSTTA